MLHTAKPHYVDFGERQGRLLDITEVPSGLACGCVCPACGDRLIARKGKMRTHHFAHQAGTECTAGGETALHRMCKEILEEHPLLMLPAKTVAVSGTNNMGKRISHKLVVAEEQLAEMS